MDSSNSISIAGAKKRTDLYSGPENVINTELHFFLNAKRSLDTCINYPKPLLSLRSESIKKSFMEAKSRGVKIRYLTEVTMNNIDRCKELMGIVDDFRHLEGIMSNFMLSESEYLAPLGFTAGGKIISEIVYSNIDSFVEQQQYFFDIHWNKAENGKQKIKVIENGTKADFIETIRDYATVQRLVISLIREAKVEILSIFSTANAFQRQTRAGGSQTTKRCDV